MDFLLTVPEGTDMKINQSCPNADLLPFEFSRLSQTLTTYAGEVRDLARDLQQKVDRRNRRTVSHKVAD